MLQRVIRAAFVVFLLAALLTGCSQPASPTVPASTSTVPATSSTTTGATTASSPTTAPSPTAAPSPTTASTPVMTVQPTPASTSPTPPSPQLPVTVTDATGAQVTVTDVSRIVPLNGDIAEIVWALGLGDRIVGVDTSATYPPELQARPKIGYQRALSAEGILSLRPTVVIGTPLAGPREVLEQLRTAGIPVVIVEAPVTLEAPMVKIRKVAQALGVTTQGELLAAQVEREIQAARELAARATSQPRVVYLHAPGAHEPQVAGLGTAAHVMIDAAGAIDAAAAAGIQGYKPLTAEAMTAAAPDAILMFEGDLAAAGGIEGVVQLPGIAQTPAGQNRAVYAFEAQYLLGLGPRTGQALRELVLKLHPELGAAR